MRESGHLVRGEAGREGRGFCTRCFKSHVPYSRLDSCRDRQILLLCLKGRQGGEKTREDGGRLCLPSFPLGPGRPRSLGATLPAPACTKHSCLAPGSSSSQAVLCVSLSPLCHTPALGRVEASQPDTHKRHKGDCYVSLAARFLLFCAWSLKGHVPSLRPALSTWSPGPAGRKRMLFGSLFKTKLAEICPVRVAHQAAALQPRVGKHKWRRVWGMSNTC